MGNSTGGDRHRAVRAGDLRYFGRWQRRYGLGPTPLFPLDLISFLDDLHNIFGRQGREAWPGCLLVMGGTVTGIWTIWFLST